jgi:hypothetical protein
MTSLQLQTNTLAQGRGNTFDGSYGRAFGYPFSGESWTLIDYMTLMPVLTTSKLSNTLSKPFTSGATSSDNGGLVLTYSSNMSETVALTDPIVMNSVKGLTEAINITMAGAIVANPYAAEEYGVATDLLSPGSLLD